MSIGSVVSNCVQGPVVNMGMAIASTSSFYQLLSGGVDAAPATPANPLVHGPNPTLPASAGVNDNVAMQVDFRSVYTSILKDWFQVPQATLSQLFGQAFPYVPVIKQTALATTPGAEPPP